MPGPEGPDDARLPSLEEAVAHLRKRALDELDSLARDVERAQGGLDVSKDKLRQAVRQASVVITDPAVLAKVAKISASTISKWAPRSTRKRKPKTTPAPPTTGKTGAPDNQHPQQALDEGE